MIPIYRCLPSSLGFSLAFELSLASLLVAAVRRSAAGLDPHAAPMRTPRRPTAYYHGHQAPKVGPTQTRPTRPLPTALYIPALHETASQLKLHWV